MKLLFLYIILVTAAHAQTPQKPPARWLPENKMACETLLVALTLETDNKILQNTLYHIFMEDYPLFLTPRFNDLLMNAMESSLKKKVYSNLTPEEFVEFMASQHGIKFKDYPQFREPLLRVYTASDEDYNNLFNNQQNNIISQINRNLVYAVRTRTLNDYQKKTALQAVTTKMNQVPHHFTAETQAAAKKTWDGLSKEFLQKDVDILALFHNYPQLPEKDFDKIIELFQMIEKEPTLKNAMLGILGDLALSGETWTLGDLTNINNFNNTVNHQRGNYATHLQKRPIFTPPPQELPVAATALTAPPTQIIPVSDPAYESINQLLKYPVNISLDNPNEIILFTKDITAALHELNLLSVTEGERFRSNGNWNALFQKAGYWVKNQKKDGKMYLNENAHKSEFIRWLTEIKRLIDNYAITLRKIQQTTFLAQETLQNQIKAVETGLKNNQDKNPLITNHLGKTLKHLQGLSEEFKSILIFTEQWEQSCSEVNAVFIEMNTEIREKSTEIQDPKKFRELMNSIQKSIQLDKKLLDSVKKGLW